MAFFTGIFQRKYLKFALTKSLKIKYNTPILFCAKGQYHGTQAG
ncbi:hypothetical protein HMPREF9996_00018 [Aggregatibacter actinomycetemcomitans Y4]|nr:hypothetical protein HMPREF9996_00018 [Aggregatibacter actinomycetemcomitans Y4]